MESFSYVQKRIQDQHLDVPDCPEYGHFRIAQKKIQTTELENLSIQIEDKQAENIDEALKQLYKAIEYLSDIEKSIVLLYLEDKPYDEIAEITGITANYVAVKMNRIKKN